MTTEVVSIIVELEGYSSVSLPFNPGEKVEDVVNATRRFFSLTVGFLDKKKSRSTASFAITLGQELISVDYYYQFSVLRPVIIYNSVLLHPV